MSLNFNSLLDEWDRPNKDLYSIESEALVKGICLRYDTEEKTKELLEKIFDVQYIGDHPSMDADYYRYMNLTIYKDDIIQVETTTPEGLFFLSPTFRPINKAILISTILEYAKIFTSDHAITIKISLTKGQTRINYESSLWSTNFSQYLNENKKSFFPKKMSKEARIILSQYIKERNLLKLQMFIDHYQIKLQTIENEAFGRVIEKDEVICLTESQLNEVQTDLKLEFDKLEQNLAMKKEYLVLLRDSCTIPKENVDYSCIG